MGSRTQSQTFWPLKANLRLRAVSGVKADQTVSADWNAYAATYDLLSDYNPAYQSLLAEFEGVLAHIEEPQVIYDVGGGTGNYTKIAARRYPESSIYLIEPDEGMRSRAKEKLSGYDNVAYIDRPFQDVDAPAKADLVVCAHALYSMPNPQDRLADIKNLLNPGGLLFLLDLGRPMNVRDWRSFLFSHLTKELGFLKAIQIVWKGREIAKQNKAIFKAQQDSLYWTHSESEIALAVEKAGFEILTQKTVYRGYSDLLLCRALPLQRD